MFEKNRYSVPHSLVGKKVDLKVTASMVEAYSGGERVASHPRFPSFVQYRYSTDESHMPPQFAKVKWDDGRILRWAKDIGPSTHAVVARIFDGVQVKEQAYNPALAVLNLTKRYSERDLEDACEYALAKTSRPRCKFIKTVLASRAAERARGDEDGSGDGGDGGGSGGYIRGEGYYNDGDAEGGDARC